MPQRSFGTQTTVSGYDYLLLVVGTNSGAIMLLMIAGLFSPIRVLALGLLLALGAAMLLRANNGGLPENRDDGEQSLSSMIDPWLAGCLLLALFFRANFFTNYIGGQDQGLYVVFSGILNHFGGPYFPDVFRSTLPDALQAIYDIPRLLSIVPLGDGLRYYSAFYPLHPGWMAVFSGLFGADMHGLAVLLFSLLGISGAYFLTHELAESDGRWTARLAALLMAINPILSFFAKYTVSETLTAALLLNAAYLLTKGLKSDGRKQLFLLGSSLLLVTAYFFTRTSWVLLVVPWGALYLYSCSRWLDGRSARRLRAYLWLLVAACGVAVVVYYEMLPIVLSSNLAGDYKLPRHYWPIAAFLAVIVLAGFVALASEPIRNRLQPLLEFGIAAAGRAAPWLPLVFVLASIPSVIELVHTGRLLGMFNVTPESTNFRYHTIYRWMLAVTPFFWCLLLALPSLVKRQTTLTIPLLFVCATLALTEAYAPGLPSLYHHVRYLSSEVIPFSLVVVSIVLVAMWHSPGWRRHLAMIALLLAVPFMLTFSILQLRGKEGEDPHFFHELDHAVAGNDVLVVDESEAGNGLIVPLRYYFDKHVFIIPEGTERAQVRQILEYLLKNSGSEYGRILLLARGQSFDLPLTRTFEARLTYKESLISNTEHIRGGTLQSHSRGRFLLPYAWHTKSIPFALYRVTGVPAWDYHLSFGCPIDFSENGGSALYTGKGWSHQETSARWTDGAAAALRVRLQGSANAEAQKRIYMDFRAAAFGGSQRVMVSVDGKQASELRLDGERRDYEIAIDLDNPELDLQHEIVFRLPDAHSPQSVGMTQDPRQLGISMSSLTFLDSTRTPGKCN